MFTPSAKEPVPAVVKPANGLVLPTFDGKVRTPPVVRARVPGVDAVPSIVLEKLKVFVPPLVTVAVVDPTMTGALNEMFAPALAPEEIVQVPSPIAVLGEFTLMLMAPAPVVLTTPLVSICTPV
jgi:hypothetical protein